LKRLSTAIPFVLMLTCALLSACSEREGGARVVYGLTLPPSGIDPHVHRSSELGIPLTSVYDTLVFLDPGSGEYVPGLAERWEMSDGGLAYTFHLRQDVHFHDGTPFNADAVRFNLDRITSDQLASQKARYMLGPYDSTEEVDEYTVRIHLTEPFAPLLEALSQVYLGMASPAAVEKWGSDYQLHQVGTGPYAFVEYAPGDHLLLRRNPDYSWGPSVYENEIATVEEIEFRFFTDPATRWPALQTGDADIMGEIPPQHAAQLEADPAFRIEAAHIPGPSLMLFLNTTRPPLDDARVRQALVYGTDRDAIVDVVWHDTSPVAHGPLAAITFAYEAQVEDYYLYDPRRAQALLDQAGWTDSDGDRVRDRGGEPLELDVYPMDWGQMPEVAELLQAQWLELGIAVNGRVVTFVEASALAEEGRHHAIPLTLSGSDPDTLRQFFHSEATSNWSKVEDPELDAWLDEACRTSDREDRIELYSQVQLRVMDEALVIPIRDYVNLNGVAERVEGLRFDAQGWFPWLIDLAVEAE
jgi:peptide/nickel transport system substrate-binding protein